MYPVTISDALRRTLAVGVLLTGAVGCSRAPAPASGGPPPVPVAMEKARTESIPVELRVVGSVQPSETVEVKSQVTGELLRVHFREGTNVAAGALLFEIDPRPFEEKLRMAEATVARDHAILAQAEATLARDMAQAANADAEQRRYAQLAKEGVSSREREDEAQTRAVVARESARASQAAIDSAKASLQADLSAMESAKLNLSYCYIHAAIAGRTGDLLIHEGNLIGANDQTLVVIHKISPIFVEFSIPEQHLALIRKQNAARSPSVTVTAKDDPAMKVEGRLSLVNNEVDTSTGTVKLKAVFANRSAVLWPGQFVDVTMHLDTIQGATVVPAEAVQAGQNGRFVYLVKADSTVEPRPVETGQSFQGNIVIASGVSPGETVVTDGHLRLYPGAKVVQAAAEILGGEPAQGGNEKAETP